MKVKVFRPHLDDVERLSYGKGAKKQRGTGSRSICHRLNQNERKLYDLAKKAGYLSMRGTGYRKERSGSPLWNIFRQRCDALGDICVVVEKRYGEKGGDVVVIDFSTLRVWNDDRFVESILDKVFKVNYPDLYLDLMKCHHHHHHHHDDDDEKDSHAGGPSKRINTFRAVSSSSKTYLSDPIDREAVKTKPIWGVNERLVTVTCSRDVAKAVAMDVVKESHNFDFSRAYQIDNDADDNNGNFEDQSEGCCTSNNVEKIKGTCTAIMEPIWIAGNNVNPKVDYEDDGSIDWDDI